MNRDELKQLISAYADGEAGPEEIARAIDAIKSDAEYRTFQRDIRKLKREFKRLHNPAVFSVFQKAWRERLEIRQDKTAGRRIPVNAIVLTAAAVVIFFGGYFLLNQRPGVNMMEKTASSADSAVFESEAPEVMMQEMMPDADMASDESAAAGSALAEEPAAEAAARAAEGAYYLPVSMKMAFIHDLENITDDYTLEQGEDGTRLYLEITPDQYGEFIDLAEAYGISVDDAHISGIITIIFQ